MKQLVNDIHQNAKDHGWWEEKREFGTLLALVHSEVSEAFEEFRNGHSVNETYYSIDKQGNHKMEGVPSELADIVIRVFDLCGAYNIDIEQVIREKHEYNKKRSYKHGGKVC